MNFRTKQKCYFGKRHWPEGSVIEDARADRNERIDWSKWAHVLEPLDDEAREAMKPKAAPEPEPKQAASLRKSAAAMSAIKPYPSVPATGEST